MTKSHKKLIEVALPLEAINKASAREKSIRHGHPSTLHLWWARRPLAAARAVIFSQMVDDPSSNPDLFPTAKKQEKERQRLFKIIEDLVLWENTTDEKVLQAARDEIWQSWRRACAENVDHPRAKDIFNRQKLPGFHDPFAGGGALPLEAQRLGLESYASDLNPVAVLINKSMIEIPPKFAGKPPVNPEARKGQLDIKTWKGAQGLAEDVRYYGQWMRDEAEKRIGNLYPKIEITTEMAKERPDLKKLVGEKLTVIAWLWARTVKSPNPAFRDVDVPLASTFLLSSKSGKESYVEPVIEKGTYHFTVHAGKPKDVEAAENGTKLARGANFKCVMSGTPIAGDYIKAEGKAKRMGARLMAIVAEGERGRIYIAPTPEHEKIVQKAKPEWKPEQPLPNDPRNFWTVQYGLETFGDLFTERQLVALTTFSDLAQHVVEQVKSDIEKISDVKAPKTPSKDETEVLSYAQAVAMYLVFAIDKISSNCNSVSTWHAGGEKMQQVFARQAIPMAWDYAEVNPFSGSTGNWMAMVDWTWKSLETLPANSRGHAEQGDAQTQSISKDKVVSTDPPYYDNICYADLSDFFYVWLRRSLRSVFKELFSTVSVPKAEELVATPYRHGGKAKAEAFFLEGMTKAMHRLAEQSHQSFPVTVYYAFKQSENESDSGTSSTGWETFLEAVIRAGFGISGTWPMRTEMRARANERSGTNMLASSIILVCRPRIKDAPTATRREFVATLKKELPEALRHLQAGNIAPVDLAQSSIGPGMAIFTRYSKVLDVQGNAMSVREALELINEVLDEALAEQEGDFDSDSRWALAWFEQFGFAEGEFGVAEILTKAKNTSVQGLDDAGILKQGRGKVRLLKPDELQEDWDPDTDARLTNWETVHHLIRVLASGGENAASELVSKLGSKAETARELAYRLYTLCERKKRANEALAYNGLVQSWPELIRLAQQGGKAKAAEKQDTMFKENE
jgi:putative DNA methylase